MRRVLPNAADVPRKDVLTPFEDFERDNGIQETRNDVPYKYLGVSPSKFYRVVDMDVKKLRKKMERSLKKIS